MWLCRVISKNIHHVEGLPEGYRVLAVYNRPEYGAFDFIVHHHEFSPVTRGAMIPYLENQIMVYREYYPGEWYVGRSLMEEQRRDWSECDDDGK